LKASGERQATGLWRSSLQVVDVTVPVVVHVKRATRARCLGLRDVKRTVGRDVAGEPAGAAGGAGADEAAPVCGAGGAGWGGGGGPAVDPASATVPKSCVQNSVPDDETATPTPIAR
jgi:hypothetical protein